MDIQEIFEHAVDDEQRLEAAMQFVRKNKYCSFGYEKVLECLDEINTPSYRNDFISLVAPKMYDIHLLIPHVFSYIGNDVYNIKAATTIKLHMDFTYKIPCSLLAELFDQFYLDSYRERLAVIFRCNPITTCYDIVRVLTALDFDPSRKTVLNLLPRPCDPQKGHIIHEAFDDESYISTVEEFLGESLSTLKKQKKAKKEIALMGKNRSIVVGEGSKVAIDGEVFVIDKRSLKINEPIKGREQTQTLNGMTTGIIENGERITDVHVLDSSCVRVGRYKFGGGSLKYNDCIFSEIFPRTGAKDQIIFRFTDVDGKQCMLFSGLYIIRDGFLYDGDNKLVEMFDPYAKRTEREKNSGIAKDQDEIFARIEKEIKNNKYIPSPIDVAFTCARNDEERIEAIKKLLEKDQVYLFDHSLVLILFKKMDKDIHRANLMSLIENNISYPNLLLPDIFAIMTDDHYRIQVARSISRWLDPGYTMPCHLLASIFKQFNMDSYRRDLLLILRCVSGVTSKGMATVLAAMKEDSYRREVLALLHAPSDLENAWTICSAFDDPQASTDREGFLKTLPFNFGKEEKKVFSGEKKGAPMDVDGNDNVTLLKKDVVATIPEEKECIICNEGIADHAYTCGHLYCGKCANKIKESSKQCPTCRKDIQMIIKIFPQ